MSGSISPVSAPAPKIFNIEDSRCNICQEEFDTGDEPEIPLTLSCGHVLGSVCLSRWLHVPDRKNGCPLCRKRLFKAREDADDELEEGEIEEEDGEEDEDVDMLLEQEETAWANIIHAHHNSAPAGSQPPIEDELSDEMHRIFDRWPSTSAVIEMLRSPRSTRNPALVIESLLNDHRLSSSTPLRRRHSYREITADLYTRLTTALSQVSNWLSTRPAFNSHACSCLHHHLHLSLLATSSDFRAHDKTHLINLLKAGALTSPRMNISFSLRLLIAENISSDLLPFGDGENPLAAHMYRVLDAMPNLCGVYEEINVAERRDPCYIAEYDFGGVWEADMANGGAGLGEGGRRSWDLMSAAPITVGDEAGAGEGGGEGDGGMAAISAAVNRTLVAANALLGAQAGIGANPIAEPETAENGTESISQQIDRTLARAQELIRNMDTPESEDNQAGTTHAENEPRGGRGGRRGLGRGHRGGSGRQ